MARRGDRRSAKPLIRLAFPIPLSPHPSRGRILRDTAPHGGSASRPERRREGRAAPGGISRWVPGRLPPEGSVRALKDALCLMSQAVLPKERAL